MTDSIPKSRLPRTGTLVLIAVVLLIGGGALMVWLPYHRNQTAIAEVERLGGYTKSEIVHPFWIPDAVDDEYLWVFERVLTVHLGGTKISDAGLEHLRGLMNLKLLNLDSTQVTDAGLEHLQELTNLRTLVLYGTKVSDTGLEHLHGLTKLRKLWLGSTHVSDVGLEHLRGLINLYVLDLVDTQVTQVGLERLQQALPDCYIGWIHPSEIR